MVTRIVVLMLAAAFLLSLPLMAQDKEQKEVKKEGKAEMMKMDKKPEKEMSMGDVKSFSCDDACGFMMKSRDEKELTEAAMKHIKHHHNMSPSEKEVKAMLKTEKKDEMKK